MNNNSQQNNSNPRDSEHLYIPKNYQVENNLGHSTEAPVVQVVQMLPVALENQDPFQKEVVLFMRFMRQEINSLKEEIRLLKNEVAAQKEDISKLMNRVFNP